MKPKTIVTLALVIFVCATAAYLVSDEVRSRSVAREAAQSEPAQTGPDGAADLTTNKLPATTQKSDSTSRVSEEKGGRPTDSTPLKQSAAPAGPQSVALNSERSKSSEPQQPAPASTQKVLAYYFHGTQRCPTCMKLEAYSAEAIQSGFGEALRNGWLEWRVVNTDEPGNEHFVSDYKLYTKSLVIVKMQNGKQVEWKNLEKIWELVGEKDDFIKYVQEEVSAYLGEKR
ncbi:MAG: nitrophenyl compound nitroreductase subunit ArsF family protein [Candidatus Eisenbacteria bacterium]|nr:nitrophenyl compound nitroreductase subunit ArsF family protein [Candidatus Eisenbacteria bacterium]